MDAHDRFRELHQAGPPLLLPNAWDYTSAAALVDAGFVAIGTTSLGVTAANGLPDGRGLGREETVALARRLAGLPCLLSVDIEAGFGADPAGVAELAATLADLGVVGVNLEDGRPDGTLAEPEEQAEYIAAVKARTPELFVNARTDTHWAPDLNADTKASTLTRAKRYVDAGADGVFVPGLAEDEAIAEVVNAVAVPVNILFQPPWHRVERLADLGVRRISTGSLLFRTAVWATVRAAQAIRAGEPFPADPPSYAEIQRLIGFPL